MLFEGSEVYQVHPVKIKSRDAVTDHFYCPGRVFLDHLPYFLQIKLNFFWKSLDISSDGWIR